MERNEALEAAIRAARDDAAPYLVYADWLQARGEPLGELIVLQHGGKPYDALLGKLGLPELSSEWRWGFWKSLRVAAIGDWMQPFDRAVAEAAFAHPVCCALEALSFGVLNWDTNHVDVPAVIALAGKHAWARELRALHLGDLSDVDVDMAHHVIGDVGAAITAAFPGLERLVLHSGDQSWRGEGETFAFGGLALPRLRELTIETCAMTTARLAALMDAQLPALDTLRVWFGATDYDAHYDIADVTPLLAGDRHGGVRRLGLCNSEFANDLALALTELPIAARLVELDLSKGTLIDETAHRLAGAAASFPRLEVLDVSDSYLTAEGIAALRAAFREVRADGQRDDGDDRYVSVYE